MRNSITDIPGIRVGHAQDFDAMTGCTVVLCEKGAVAGMDVRGGAPGTRETDCLAPGHLVQHIHAVLLTGGSAFGLDAAGGVMKFLEERGIGFDTGAAKVPIVPAAVIYDLRVGRADVRPDKKMGEQACMNAKDNAEQGSVGAGCGATVGKLLGINGAMKGGVGTASVKISGGVIAGALAVVNAFGDVLDENGKILAGARDEKGNFINTAEVIKTGKLPSFTPGTRENTTLCVVATNAKLTKEEAQKLAQVSHNGLARAVSPCHTLVDGDLIFALSYGNLQSHIDAVGVAAQEAVASAIRSAVRHAKSIAGIPAITNANIKI